MRLWKWFRDLPLGVQIFYVLGTILIFVTLVPSPFTD